MPISSYIHTVLPGKPGGSLFFLFHGTGADETQFLSVGRELEPHATLVAPRGDVSEHGAARYFRRTAEGVYDMDDLARASAKMAGFVRAHIERARPSRVIGLGYSNGANILAATMFHSPILFDAAVLMHPLIPFAPKVDGSLDAARALITAGRRDPICPPALTSRLDAELRTLGCDVQLVWHDGGHEVRPNEIVAAHRFIAELHKAGGQDD